MNIEWNIDNEFTLAQRRGGGLEVMAHMKFPIYDEHLAKLDDDALMRETIKVSNRLYPGFKDCFDEIIDCDGDTVVVSGMVTFYAPVTDDENVIVEYALDSVEDKVDGGSEIVVELFIDGVVDM